MVVFRGGKDCHFVNVKPIAGSQIIAAAFTHFLSSLSQRFLL
jgi:hypothetical protein